MSCDTFPSSDDFLTRLASTILVPVQSTILVSAMPFFPQLLQVERDPDKVTFSFFFASQVAR